MATLTAIDMKETLKKYHYYLGVLLVHHGAGAETIRYLKANVESVNIPPPLVKYHRTRMDLEGIGLYRYV